jgi:hypothetical protein
MLNIELIVGWVSLLCSPLFFLRFLIMQPDTINKLKLWEILDYYDRTQIL